MQPIIKEVHIQRILNPTAIDLGEFVINPFMGCAFGCLYCYVRSNRVTARRSQEWGTYVDVRVNAAELLEKELARKKPARVLLGSTTECFQPLEQTYRIMRKVLEVLIAHQVRFTILTRSPLAVEYIELLASGYCENIYFTMNAYADAFKNELEPLTPAFSARIDALRTLQKAGVPVVASVSPLLPWVTDWPGLCECFSDLPVVGFEGLNFNLTNIRAIIDHIARVDPECGQRYARMHADRDYYDAVWSDVRTKIAAEAKRRGRQYDVFVHGFGRYFENSYVKK